MTKLVVFEPFSGFSTISPEFDATNYGKAQWLCPGRWVGLNIHAWGNGRGLTNRGGASRVRPKGFLFAAHGAFQFSLIVLMNYALIKL